MLIKPLLNEQYRVIFNKYVDNDAIRLCLKHIHLAWLFLQNCFSNLISSNLFLYLFNILSHKTNNFFSVFITIFLKPPLPEGHSFSLNIGGHSGEYGLL